MINPPTTPQQCAGGSGEAVFCFSHLRWDFVYQRPQHLMTRFARQGPVFFMEEPISVEGDAGVTIRQPSHNLNIVVPLVPRGASALDTERHLRAVVDRLAGDMSPGTRIIAWYYTAMALTFSQHLLTELCVYDCMDELSAFLGAAPKLREMEGKLFARADLVFTGGQSLFEAKRRHHPFVYAFPSSIDKAHFMKARYHAATEPADLAEMPWPRIGFFGVIDERIDLRLLEVLADENPDLQFIMVGPVVKIDPATLPQRPNIHWLGGRRYEDLPKYLAGWSAGFMPFALNEATQFISPTKTPEFLAAGVPVVSSAVRDVVNPYEQLGLVAIGSSIDDWSRKLRIAAARKHDAAWLAAVDTYLRDLSWDATFARMAELMRTARGAEPAPRGAIRIAGEDQVNV